MTTERVTTLLKAIDEAGSAMKLADAVRALVDAVQETAGVGWVEMVPNLLAALDYNNPGAAVAAVDGLIAIGEPAVMPLLSLLESGNYGTRAWALRALSGIGDPRSLSLLLDTAQHDFAVSVRRAAVMGLGTIHWEQMEAAAIPAAQASVFSALMKACRDEEWVVRYAAIAAIERLLKVAQDLELRQQGCDRLMELAETDEEISVKARAILAGERFGG
jgi:phycocyanobilin lyase subunit beta